MLLSKNFDLLGETHRNLLLKMSLLLFPQYESATLTNKGIIVLKYKDSLFKHNRIPFFDMVSDYIPKRIARYRWANDILATEYLQVLLDFAEDSEQSRKSLNIKDKDYKTQIEKIQLIETKRTISYLYTVTLGTKLRDLYNNYWNITTVLNENNEETVVTSRLDGEEVKHIPLFITDTNNSIRLASVTSTVEKIEFIIKKTFLNSIAAILLGFGSVLVTWSNSVRIAINGLRFIHGREISIRGYETFNQILETYLKG